MEPRFGHDDKKSAESASSVNSLAYTIGNDTVFNNGQYSPNTIPGNKLLGYELVHIIQQSPTTSPGKLIQRIPDPFYSPALYPWDYNTRRNDTDNEPRQYKRIQNCTENDKEKISQAIELAKTILDFTINQLDYFLGLTSSPLLELYEQDSYCEISELLRDYFSLEPPSKIIVNMISLVYNLILRGFCNNNIKINCEYNDDGIGAIAYVYNSNVTGHTLSHIHICPNKITLGGTLDIAGLLIHEMGHRVANLEDRAKLNSRIDPSINTLPLEAATINADTYRVFSLDIYQRR